MNSIISMSIGIEKENILKGWKGKENSYTPDDLIEAYDIGKKDGKSEANKILINAFKNNIDKAGKISERLLSNLRDKYHVKHAKVYLRANTISNFDSIFIVDKDSFNKKEFKPAYDHFHNESSKESNDTFHWYFSFLPLIDELDEEALKTDGYIWAYEAK